MPKHRYVKRNAVCEWGYTSAQMHPDPFNEIEVDVVFSSPEEEVFKVPAYWAGGQEWRIRFAAPTAGTYTYESVCSDPSDQGLHGQSGTLTVGPNDGGNDLLTHGRLQVSASRRYLEHQDGTPFFWLADTWWMGLCQRLRWPEEFQLLTEDRVRKGFSVVQTVAGLYPDMPAFDERGANEAGFPWEKDYGKILPAYFDMADLRVQWLARSGLVPCIVGFWGYFLSWMGVAKAKQHWRNLVARYGAYPVVWCLAGEGVMPFYLSQNPESDAEFQKQSLTELAAYVREIDPYHNPVTVHPTDKGRDQVQQPALLDIDMLQTGHGSRPCLPNTIDTVVQEYDREPRMPVINSEVCYEGIGEGCRQEVQRLMFWASVLNGAAGHTYGANGIWQLNTRDKPYGRSPHGGNWGNTAWEDAYQLPGSGQLGACKRLLERYAWWQFEPHPEWVEPHWTKEIYDAPFAAGIPGEVRIVYTPLYWQEPTIKMLEPCSRYRAYMFNQIDGTETDFGEVTPDANGDWLLPRSKHPFYQDWVFVLETPTARHGPGGDSRSQSQDIA